MKAKQERLPCPRCGKVVSVQRYWLAGRGPWARVYNAHFGRDGKACPASLEPAHPRPAP